jgi:predicted transcriptional regulator
MKLASSVQECIEALGSGNAVYAKNGIGDWIKVDAVYPDGSARVADALSGFNDDTIGRLMTVDSENSLLRIRDLEIQ